MQQIIIASNNSGKINEFQQLFSSFGIQITPQAQLKVTETDEPYQTFIENSLHKARHCAKITGLPALADDSGLCVEALGGAPGIHSARYAGEPRADDANIRKLLSTLAGSEERSAYFYCSLVFVRSANDPQPIIAEGVFRGEIATQAQGLNGHGYDPIFWLPELQLTAAELDAKVKNRISHRGKALQELITKLQQANLIIKNHQKSKTRRR